MASLVLTQSTIAQTTFTVANSSFESPDLSDSAYAPNSFGFVVPNWQAELFGGADSGFQDSAEYQYKNTFGNNSPLPAPADGGQFAYLETASADSSASLTTRDPITTIVADTDYFLTVALGNELETHPDNDPKNKHPGTVIVAILIDDQIAASETRDDATLPKGAFTDVTVSFRAASGSPFVGRPLKARVTQVSTGSGASGYRVDFDNVRLATGAAATPTPTPPPTPSPTPAVWKSRVVSSFPGSPSFNFDSDAAVGPSHFVEVTNAELRVYDKANGNVVFSTPNIFANKMSLDYGVVVDQRIRFDQRTQRWIAIGIVNVGSSQSGFVVGRSESSDPTGAWKGFFLRADPNGQLWCDYPLFGIDDSAVYLSAQLIPLGGGSKTFHLFTIPKADVLAATPTGVNATRLRFDDSVARIPDPHTDYSGSTGDGTLSVLQPWPVGNQPGVRCTKWSVSGASGAGATLQGPVAVDTAVPQYNRFGDERQPHTAQTLGRNSGAVTSTRVGRFLYTVEIFWDGILWAKIDAETNTGVQGGYIGDPNHVYFDPAISANEDGAVVIAYGRSGPQEFGSSYASVGTLGTDGELSFDPPLLLRAGFDIYDDTATPTDFGGARWSDYSTAVSVDPLDPSRFWISGAYVSGRNRASTHVTQLAITPTAAGTTLANLSTRLRVETGDDVLIGGFIVTGAQSKELIVRAIGPSLSVADRLANPTLQLTAGDGNVVEFNDDWQQSPNRQAIIDSTIPPADDVESAVAASLGPGAYTAVVRGMNGGTGVGLVEVYDLDGSSETRLANISTRGRVQTGENVLIAGTIVIGQSSQRVLIRALGPSLDVPGKLLDPTLELVDGNGMLVAANDNWRSTQETEIVASTIPPPSDQEAAIVATLAPALYTAIVRGVRDSTGVGLVEIYALESTVVPPSAARRAKMAQSHEPIIGLLPQEPTRRQPLRSKATL